MFGAFLFLLIIDKFNKYRIRKFFIKDFRLNEEMTEWFICSIETKKLLNENTVEFTTQPTQDDAKYLIDYYYKNFSQIEFQISCIKSTKANLLCESIDKMFVIFNDFNLITIRNHLFNRRCNFFETDYISEISNEKDNIKKASQISHLLLDLKFYLEYYDDFLIHMKFPEYYLKVLKDIKSQFDKTNTNVYKTIVQELLFLKQKARIKS